MKYSMLAFRIIDAAEHHDEIARELADGSPSHHKAGDPVGAQFPDARIRSWPTDVVVIQSPVESEDDLNAHFRWLEDFLMRHKSYLLALVNRKGVATDVYVGMGSDTRVNSLSFRPELLKTLSAFGIGLFLRIVNDPVFGKANPPPMQPMP